MAVRIGHAAIDENGNAHSGTAGDQNGREVCIRSWYSKPWALVLRAKSSTVAEKMAKACEDGCNNPNIGYDQWGRNTLNTQAKKVGYDLSKITAKCETDCSAFMAVCAQAAGVDIPYSNGNAPTTYTMKKAFTGTGQFDALTDSKYLDSDKHLKRGDILVKPSSHTVMVLDNGEAVQVENTKPATGDIGVGSIVAIKASAAQYYPGARSIPAYVKEDYYHTVTQDKLKSGKIVIKGGKTCVLLGKKVKKSGGSTLAGINTWVALDNLELVSGGVETEAETPKNEAPVSSKVDAARSFDNAKAGTYTVKANGGLRLRSGAATTKAIIEVMANGSTVKCYGYYTGEWLYVISAKGHKGFCHVDYLIRK